MPYPSQQSQCMVSMCSNCVYFYIITANMFVHKYCMSLTMTQWSLVIQVATIIVAEVSNVSTNLEFIGSSILAEKFLLFLIPIKFCKNFSRQCHRFGTTSLPDRITVILRGCNGFII